MACGSPAGAGLHLRDHVVVVGLALPPTARRAGGTAWWSRGRRARRSLVCVVAQPASAPAASKKATRARPGARSALGHDAAGVEASASSRTGAAAASTRASRRRRPSGAADAGGAGRAFGPGRGRPRLKRGADGRAEPGADRLEASADRVSSCSQGSCRQSPSVPARARGPGAPGQLGPTVATQPWRMRSASRRSSSAGTAAISMRLRGPEGGARRRHRGSMILEPLCPRYLTAGSN